MRNRFIRFRQGHIEEFWCPLWKWLLALSWPEPPEGFSLDLGSTVFQRSGNQEGAKRGYNPSHPGRDSHYPLLPFLAEAPLVLDDLLRCGNTGSARRAAVFLTKAFALMPRAVAPQSLESLVFKFSKFTLNFRPKTAGSGE